MATRLKGFQDFRKKATEAEPNRFKYKTHLYNHLDRPIPPYIFGTVFDEADKPIGETSLIEQAAPLQVEIDKRKRQFADNADIMNGVWKIDTNLTQISRADAQRAKADPQGVWFGPGVSAGVQRETGKELPSFLANDLQHSITEVDNIFGTQPTFRGEKGTTETATGRAILREASFQRLNEFIDLMDYIHELSYNWWLQMVRVRYTESHFVKPLGATRARETIDLHQDDINEGVEVKVIPGQITPEDRLFKSERAKEAAEAQLLTPLSFYEAAGFDNPMEEAKRLEMYKINPFSVLDMTPEDIARLQKSMQMLAGLQPQQAGGEAGAGDQEKAQKVAQLRRQTEELTQSREFQALPPEQQRAALDQIKQRLAAVASAT